MRSSLWLPPVFALAAAVWSSEHHDPDAPRRPPVLAPRAPGRERASSEDSRSSAAEKTASRARPAGFARLSGRITGPEGPRPGVRVELIEDGRLEATRLDLRSCGQAPRPHLLDPSCEHAAASLFELFDGRALEVQSQRATTSGATGWFAFDALPQGRYALFLPRAADPLDGADTASMLIRGIELAPFDGVTLELEPAPAASLAGDVRSLEGEPIPGAEILAIDPRLGVVARAESTAAGRFELVGLDPDVRYHVVARAPEHAPKARAEVAAGSDPVTFELDEAAAIAGVVTRRGQPVARARVEVDALVTPQITDDQGRFRLEALTAGFHVIRVTRGRGEGRRVEIEALAAGTRALGVELEAVCDVFVRVTDEAGTPVPGADVQLLAIGTIDHRAAETDAEGTAQLELLTLGSYTVDVRPPVAAAKAGLGAATWTLALEPGCTHKTEQVTLSGRLVRPRAPEGAR